MKKKKDRIYLFIDGTNLYAAQYELFGPNDHMGFNKLISTLEKNLVIKFTKIYFYASYSPKQKKPTKKQKQYLKNEGLFYRNVKKTPKVNFYTGHRSPTSGKEKGVDMHLGIDMVKYAFLKQYNQAYLLTGDADLIYAVETVSDLSIPVRALFMPNRFSFILAYNVRASYILNYNKCYSKKKYKKLPRSLKIIDL